MTTNLAWDPTRWRDPQCRPYYEQAATALQYASAPITSDAQRPATESSWQVGSGKPVVDEEPRRPHKLPPLTDTCTDASTYHSRTSDRNTPPGEGGYDPRNNKLRDYLTNVSSWPSLLRQDNGTVPGNKHNADAPLTLHIPKDQDLPRISTMFGTPPSGPYPPRHHSSQAQTPTTLPSFAALQEHAHRPGDANNVEKPTMSARPSACINCSKLQPLVSEVATAVAELDETIQALCNKSWSRPLDYPKETTLHAVHWILDRLRCGKADVQAAIRATQPSSGSQPTPNSLSGIVSRNISPSNSLKRPAEAWDHYDSPMQKRTQIGGSPGEAYRTNSYPSADRRGSSQFSAINHVRHSGMSPPSTESAAESAFPRAPSPAQSGRAVRALPSPSSVTYPPSAPPSLAPPNALSPTTSPAADTTFHGDSATSAHMADLQHQVTLKSLALQTLRSEYASLLQKLQRLNVKTQAMERKGNVADQEVNDLTNKNEDLSQQVQSLQEQLDDSERRREKQREDTSREKDQWLQMLEQGRRLQAKVEQDKRALAQRIAALQAECDELVKDRKLNVPTPLRKSEDAEGQISRPTSLRSTSPDNAAALKADIEVLRSALQEARDHRLQLDERLKEVLQRSTDINGVIDRALGGAHAKGEAKVSQPASDRNRDSSISPRTGSSPMAFTSPQIKPVSPSQALPGPRSIVPPGWRPQEHPIFSPQIGVARPMSHGGTSPQTASPQIPNPQEPSTHSHREYSAPPLIDFSVQRPSLETVGLRPPPSLDITGSAATAAATLPTPVTPSFVPKQGPMQWEEGARRFPSASSIAMPPPPRPAF